MAKPIKKTWGNIKLENLKDILQNRGHMITEWTDKDGNKHKQIPVKGAEWDGGNITLQAWDKEKKEAINLIYLKPDNELTSTPELKVNTTPVTKEDDGFPF